MKRITVSNTLLSQGPSPGAQLAAMQNRVAKAVAEESEAENYWNSGLSCRACNTMLNCDIHSREDAMKAFKNGTLHPAKIRGYGWQSHKEVAKWLGLPVPQRRTSIDTERLNWLEQWQCVLTLFVSGDREWTHKLSAKPNHLRESIDAAISEYKHNSLSVTGSIPESETGTTPSPSPEHAE